MSLIMIDTNMGTSLSAANQHIKSLLLFIITCIYQSSLSDELISYFSQHNVCGCRSTSNYVTNMHAGHRKNLRRLW